MEQFADLYGLTLEDVEKGLQLIQPPLPKDVVEMLVKHCDGYQFHSNQKVCLFNSGQVVYFLAMVHNRWALKPSLTGSDLFDFLKNFKEDSL